MQLHEFPHSGADDDATFIYVKVNLQYLCKVRHAKGKWSELADQKLIKWPIMSKTVQLQVLHIFGEIP